MTVARAQPRPSRRGWEGQLLTWLSYPMNIALGGLAAFLLALPIVTLLPAMIALGRSLARWICDGDDAVFTNTFREFAAIWRRSLPMGVVAAVVLVVLVADFLFLAIQITTGTSGLEIVMAAAAVPFSILALMFGLAIPIAAATLPGGTRRQWIRGAVVIIVRKPSRSILVFLGACAVVTLCVLLPSLAPFVLLSGPLLLGVLLWGRSAHGMSE